MSNQEMQFADPDWKPTQQLDKKASPQEREAYRPQPINADPREQQQWRAAQAAPPQQEGYAGLPPYAGVAPQQMQGRDFRQPQYRRRGRGPWFWIICAIILISLMSGGLGFPHNRFGKSPIEGKLIHYTVKGQPTIVINDTDGAIHVVAGKSNSDVTIQPVGQSNFFGDPNDIQVKSNQDGNTIRADVQENGPGSVDLTVTVPQGTSLQLKTGSGDITIDGVSGQETVSTSSGDINFDGTIGTGGSYQFQTDSGTVNLNGLGASEFHLVASTNSGSINVPGVSVQPNEPGPGSKASGDIGGNSQGQGTTVTITTGSGDINLNQQ